MRNKKFISIIWGYPKHLHDFVLEENYHLHALMVAKKMGYEPVAVLQGNQEVLKDDPHYDPAITIINHTNILKYLWIIIKYSFEGSVFYVNSCEWRSFLVPLIARKTIFMAHSQPKRKTVVRQNIQDVIYNFFSRIRLNNHTEKEFLLSRKIKEDKLYVVPLVASQNAFYRTNNTPKTKGILCFGNVTPTKNLVTILDAIKEVKNKHPNIQLCVIGNVWDDSFQEQIVKRNLIKNVKILGFIPQNKLVAVMNEFSLCVNSSITEGQCVAVYDAALCGCALCLPNIMSFTGVFKDKALFHDVMDYKKLAENILYYLNNPDKAIKDAEKCEDMIKSEYNQTVIEEKMKKLFTL